jgi:hypothetical protein
LVATAGAGVTDIAPYPSRGKTRAPGFDHRDESPVLTRSDQKQSKK